MFHLATVFQNISAEEVSPLLVPLMNALFDVQPQDIEIEPMEAFFATLGQSTLFTISIFVIIIIIIIYIVSVVWS